MLHCGTYNGITSFYPIISTTYIKHSYFGTGIALPIGDGKRIPDFMNLAGIRTDEWQPVAITPDL